MVCYLWKRQLMCPSVGYRKRIQGGMGNMRINLLLFSSDLLHKRQILKERHLGITLNIHTFHSLVFFPSTLIKELSSDAFLNENLIRQSGIHKTQSSKNTPAAVCKWFSGWMKGLFTHQIKSITVFWNVRGFTCWAAPTIMISSVLQPLGTAAWTSG